MNYKMMLSWFMKLWKRSCTKQPSSEMMKVPLESFVIMNKEVPDRIFGIGGKQLTILKKISRAGLEDIQNK